MLANIYLHYALDVRFERHIKPTLKGKAMLIRYADDFVVAFQYHDEAQQFYSNLSEGLKEFNLEVAPKRASIKLFSRFHPNQTSAFEFLGFQLYWDTDFKDEQRVRR